jgi:uncharacterized protein (TIGR02145 family)
MKMIQRTITIHAIFLMALLCIQNASQAQQAGELKDSRDNKKYATVTINQQTWMAENLKYKTEGVVIPGGNKPENVNTYGYLYNWEVAQKVCPSGWRIPTEDDWKTLIGALGGKYAAGLKLKSKTSDWKAPNKTGPVDIGFNALPAGKSSNGALGMFLESALFWSSEAECTSANTVILLNNAAFVDKKILPKTDLLSIRCIKN